MKRARLVLLSAAAILSLAAGIAVACPLLFVAITGPVEGQRVSGERTIAVSGTAAGARWWRPYVSVSVNGGPAAYAPVSRGRFRVLVRLTDGDNLIQVAVRAGPLYGRASRRVTYEQSTQPSFEIAVTSPAAGASVTGGRAQVVRGRISGREGAAVVVTVNGGAAVAATVVGGEFSAAVELADGDNVIVARAVAGDESVSSTVRVTYEELPPPTVAIEWPPEGQYVFGSRTVLVRGAVERATDPSVLVAVNGGTPVPASVAGDGSFTAEVRLDDGANAVVASVLAPQGAAAATTHVIYPFLTLDPFQAAARVIGQPDPTAAAPEPCGPITASDVCSPFGSAGWDGAALFLPDSGRNRVLVFDGVPAVDGAPARFALGQRDLASGAASTAAGGLGEPETIRIADGKLFVAEYANNRILVFDAVPEDFGAAAAVAVGAPSVDAAGSGACTADALLRPESFAVVGTRLIVADRGHNRVLVWNQIPTVSGTPADLVLGQPGFTSCEPNHGERSERSLFWPTDVWSDGTRLLVADTRNHRILGWSTFPDASFAPADLVLGQASFTLAELASTRAGLREPVALTSNGNQLFVVDQLNHRVLVWNSLPSSSGALPDVVLGQADFVHAAPNDADQDGAPDASPTGETLSIPAGVLVTEDALVVTDSGNSRYVVFGGR